MVAAHALAITSEKKQNQRRTDEKYVWAAAMRSASSELEKKNKRDCLLPEGYGRGPQSKVGEVLAG